MDEAEGLSTCSIGLRQKGAADVEIGHAQNGLSSWLAPDGFDFLLRLGVYTSPLHDLFCEEQDTQYSLQSMPTILKGSVSRNPTPVAGSRCVG